MELDAERLRDDIETNATFGAVAAEVGQGRTVLTGSEADKRAREYFLTRLEDADLEVRCDAVGNIVGRWEPPGCDPNGSPVAFGSHLDSVPRGGIFDGPLGTYGALEGVRTMQEADVTLDRPIEVVSFTEEEGARFGVGTLGSSVATGELDTREALELEDDDGITLRERLDGIGFHGEEMTDASEWDAWMELHIEQGTQLTDADAAVGLVESITGITNCEVTVTGAADHAGATPMFERSDALAAGSMFVLALERVAEEVATTHEAAVGTVGQGSIEPNARNIIPERVQYHIDIRDVDHGTMDTIVERCRLSLARIERCRDVTTSLSRYRDTPPTAMSERCLSAAAATTPDTDLIRLYSAAMHDTANVGGVTDAGLLFAPSEGGFSHSPREWTDWEDCVVASGVLAEAVRSLASDAE
ncbi:MAG: Zn-dependent hydrolase [Halobacteriota archaeon]|uniref:Zn-dependent hydrolase n=1 Tax=Natronomonas sp. TaxID=2184060 RepID=UPI0039748AF0